MVCRVCSRRFAVALAVAVLIISAVTSGSAFAATAPATGLVAVTQTDAALGQWMRSLPARQLGPAGTTAAPSAITLDLNSPQQPFWGVGAGVTDSSAYLIHALSGAVRSRLLHRLYDHSGLGLDFGVIPIGASDFTATGTPYSYDDTPKGQPDPHLRHFSVSHDEAWNLPVLEQIARIDPTIKLFAATWSAPAWMKANKAFDDLNFGGSLLPRYYGTFADYLVDWLRAYGARGVHVSAIAPENEPNSPAAFPSMDLPIGQEITFIQKYLAPELRSQHISTQIYGGDVGLPRTDYQADLIHSSADSDLGGLAWHCYSAPPTAIGQIAALAPTLPQIVTECAPNLSKLALPVNLLGALVNGARAFSAWNLALTSSGGPVQAPNSGCGGCRGLVTIAPKGSRYSLSQDAYTLGQIGHFVAPGAVRLTSTDEPTFYRHGSSYGILTDDGILNVAYRNPNGTLVLVTYNPSPTTQTADVSDGTEHFSAPLPPHAMTTFTWRRGSAATPSPTG